MINTLKAIGLGVVVGVLSSVGLSLTLEEEVSEWRMAVYGGFISAIASSSAVAVSINLKRNNEETKLSITSQKDTLKTDAQEIIAQIVVNGFNNHLNALQPGSPEYQKTLESYGNLLSAKTFPPPTNLDKP